MRGEAISVSFIHTPILREKPSKALDCFVTCVSRNDKRKAISHIRNSMHCMHFFYNCLATNLGYKYFRISSLSIGGAFGFKILLANASLIILTANLFSLLSLCSLIPITAATCV